MLPATFQGLRRARLRHCSDQGSPTLFGSGFTDTPGLEIASGFPLPTKLSGTSVIVNGIPAPLLAVAEQDGQAQINFQVPHFPAYAQELVIVVDNNGKAQTFYIRNWAEQLGIFGSLVHASGDPITATAPAQPGEQITIYWTEISGYDFEYCPGVSFTFIPDGIPSSPSVPRSEERRVGKECRSRW